MNTALVGYTGFVGSNLSDKFEFTKKYNSKNIKQAFNTCPDLLIYAGIRAEKFIANKEPENDMKLMKEAIENIKKINAKRLILISTIDVYKTPTAVDEKTLIQTDDLLPYGANRYYLEEKVRERYPDALIVRLPGLYGKNIKKNFIYDFIYLIPGMLSQEKFLELSSVNNTLRYFYKLQENGFYKCVAAKPEEREKLKSIFQELGFSAINFTDSRGSFQFYPLAQLWNDIEIALKNSIQLLNLATEPITISEIYEYMTGEQFCNHLPGVIPNYDFRTLHASLYGGKNGYIYNKQEILTDIKKFIQEQII